jgi:CDP-glycerol glycerophosphotransferase (TagB/SpsB family)
VLNISIINIKQFLIKENVLYIAITVQLKVIDEFNPKLEIIFTNDTENRRMPLPISEVNIDKISKTCFITSKHKYSIDNIFWDKSYVGNIKVDFSLLYGEEFIEDFEIIKDVKFSCKGNYYIPQLTGNELILKAKTKKLKQKNSNIKKFSKIYDINNFFLFLISVLAFPFFFIEGFLVFKNVIPKPDDFVSGDSPFKSILFYVNYRTYKLSRHIYSKRKFKIFLMEFLYLFLKHRKIKENRISFLSERRDDLSGNFKFVYNILNENHDLDLIQLLKNKQLKDLSISDMVKYVNLISTSQIILLDDFYPNIHNFKLKKETKLIQLWHATGAFKTFGFSRIGKMVGISQRSLNHRNYDHVIVSSDEIRRFYAEGFGISDEKVIATGIPRTDVFFDEQYKIETMEMIYKKHPILKDKKIILFAPTFRGDGKKDAFYPMNMFDIKNFFRLLDTNEDIVLVIKHHPFVKESINIPKKYRDNVLDLSENSEINDLLFITDLLITDYSSVIFEASILNIPMLFYSHDLEEYIMERDFYYDYRSFVPGKIAYTFENMIKAINNKDFDSYKIPNFKNKFFNYLDGKSSQRVVDLINNLLGEN